MGCPGQLFCDSRAVSGSPGQCLVGPQNCKETNWMIREEISVYFQWKIEAMVHRKIL